MVMRGNPRLPLCPPPPNSVGDLKPLKLILLAKYFAIKLLGAVPLNPPIQGDFESSCSPNFGGWGACEGNFPSSLLQNVDVAIGIKVGGWGPTPYSLTTMKPPCLPGPGGGILCAQASDRTQKFRLQNMRNKVLQVARSGLS
jgi:hypothetical protein